jgi:hypothetical protein
LYLTKEGNLIKSCEFKARLELYGKKCFVVSNSPQIIENISNIYPQIITRIKRASAQSVISVVKTNRIRIYYKERLLASSTNEGENLIFLEWCINSLFLNKLDNFLQIHAGAVSVNNTGILFPATNDVGKSTFTYYLLQKGFNYFSDEVGLINPKTRLIFPFPKSLALDRKTYKKRLGHPNMNKFITIKNAQKIIYQPEIRKKHFTHGVPLHYIFFLKRKRAAKKLLEECSKGEAMIELIKNSFNPLANSEKNFNQLMKLMTSVQAFFLDVSNPDSAYKSLCEVIKKR